MKNRIFTVMVMVLAAMLILQAVSSEAATYKTRLTLTISRDTSGESPNREVSTDLITDEGIFTGSSRDVQTHTDELGRSVTETVTEFRNVYGELLMSADVAITARSEDFTVKAEEIFSEVFSVDVEIRRYDEAYDSYAYSLDISGLPVWLKAEGELVSSDTLSTDITIYHHEFTISGRHESPDKAGVMLMAIVLISGDWPPMRAMGSKDVNITAEEIPKPPDEEPPEEVPTESPDMRPPESPDNPPEDIDRSGYLDTDSTESAGSISEILDGLTPEQIQAVRVLKVDGNITDLAGLEAFTNLERIDLTEAAIGSADLRGLANLKSIDIAGNISIKSLNLSGTGIQTLDAKDCTNLEQLDVSGCTSLKTLDVSNTPVKTLNAEDCTSLEVLDCSNCRLEELNISGCESLNVIDCSNNRLHKLDAYMFNRLSELLCSNQQITGWRLGRVFSFLDYFGTGFSADDGGNVSDSGAENITNIRAWDADGQEITAKYDPKTGSAEFSGVPVKLTYDYITGF